VKAKGTHLIDRKSGFGAVLDTNANKVGCGGRSQRSSCIVFSAQGTNMQAEGCADSRYMWVHNFFPSVDAGLFYDSEGQDLRLR
jgi:hypothetical protein